MTSKATFSLNFLWKTRWKKNKMTSDLFEVGGRVFWKIKVRETAKLLTSNPFPLFRKTPDWGAGGGAEGSNRFKIEVQSKCCCTRDWVNGKPRVLEVPENQNLWLVIIAAESSQQKKNEVTFLSKINCLFQELLRRNCTVRALFFFLVVTTHKL